MISRYTHKKITWVDLESPTHEEVRQVTKEFGVHSIVGNELLMPTVRSKVDLYDNFIYLILHFPVFEHSHGHGRPQEVDFIVGKNFIITTHYETIDSLHEFSRIFEVNSIIDKSHFGAHAGFVFYHLVRGLYKSTGEELRSLSGALRGVEDKIFNGKEREMVVEISRVHRHILNFKGAITLHDEVLSSLEVAGMELFGASFAYYLRAITGEYYKISNELESNREMLLELRETNDSLVSTKQNEVTKILTIMAFIILPSGFIANIFGMNATGTPIVGMPGDFWIIVVFMALTMGLAFGYFKYKRWL